MRKVDQTRLEKVSFRHLSSNALSGKNAHGAGTAQNTRVLDTVLGEKRKKLKRRL
jgi:hypothetical protein